MELPIKIREAYEKLKVEYKLGISLKTIAGRYYIYRQASHRDKESQKLKVKSIYLGKITEEGVFVKKDQKLNNLDIAKSIIEAHGGKIILPIDNGSAETNQQGTTFSKLDSTDKRLLEILSMNSKANLTMLGEKLGIKYSTLYEKVERLKKTFDLKYFTEIDIEKLGFSWFATFVKFRGIKPAAEKLKAALENEGRVQLAFLTAGGFDLIFFTSAENTRVFSDTITNIRSDSSIKNYTSDWYSSSFDQTYGCIPLREEFFEVLKNKIWKKSRENTRPKSGELLEREYIVLKELSSDASISFAEIDVTNNLPIGSASNTFEKLISEERGVIRRPTLTMQNPYLKYIMLLKFRIENRAQFEGSRKELLTNIIGKHPAEITNRFTYVGDVDMPDGVMLFLPVFSEDYAQSVEDEISNKLKGIELESMSITSILVGQFCYRKFANAHSDQYKRLLSTFNIEPFLEQVNYDF